MALLNVIFMLFSLIFSLLSCEVKHNDFIRALYFYKGNAGIKLSFLLPIYSLFSVCVCILLNEWKESTYFKKYLWLGSILPYPKAYVIEKRVLMLMRPGFDRLNRLSFTVFRRETAVTAQDCGAPTCRLAGIWLLAWVMHQSSHQMTHSIHVLAKILNANNSTSLENLKH